MQVHSDTQPPKSTQEPRKAEEPTFPRSDRGDPAAGVKERSDRCRDALRDTSHPAPIRRVPGSGPCPEPGCKTPRRPSPFPAPRHRRGISGAPSPLFPGPRDEQQQQAAVAATGLGSAGGGRSARSPGSAEPAPAPSWSPRRAGPGSLTPPYPRRERGGRRRPPSPPPLPSAAAGRAGRVGGVAGGGCYSRLKGEEETETGTAAAA